jgi:hypothetical protein
MKKKYMVIEVLSQKYKVGCERGAGQITKKFLLVQLNTIIEWSFCKFPPDENGKENKEFLGDPPELKPGDVFLFEGQVIAVDSEERLVLVISETGNRALERIWNDTIEPEIRMVFDVESADKVKWESARREDIPKEYNDTSLPYNTYKIWKDHFVAGRFEDDDNLCIMCEVTMEDYFIFPVTIFMKRWTIAYDPEEFSEDDELNKKILEQVVSWFYDNEERKAYIKPKSPTDEKKK